jgi:hypothetical protein
MMSSGAGARKPEKNDKVAPFHSHALVYPWFNRHPHPNRMSKILTTLLMITAVFAIYKIFTDYKASQHQENNEWVGKMRLLVKDHLSGDNSIGDVSGIGEGTFLRLLHMSLSAERDGYKIEDTVKEAARSAGISSTHAAYVSQAILDSIAQGRRMQAFNEPQNLLAMERGEPPAAHAAGWEDEKLVVGNIIPPSLAPEAANALANMQLIPESVREIQGDYITAPQLDVARQWLQQKIITPESMNAIKERAAESAGKKRSS